MFRLLRRTCIAAVFVTAIAFATPAQAVTGYVKGSWYLWNVNGNYCPSNNFCIGARYTQNMYDTLQPVSNATIWIVDSSGALIGAGSTDDDGNYLVVWNRSTFPDQIGVLILPYHKDGRFFMAITTGYWVANWFGLVATASSTSPSAPQDVGAWSVGWSNNPDPFYNAYWAIEWQWRFTMNSVGVLQTNFTNVEIRGFADTITGYLPAPNSDTCVSSCAWGPTKQVHLSADAAFAPQARTMHEVGHIASYVTHPWQLASSSGTLGLNYGFSGGGWNPDAPEFGSAAFEEAWATHYGSTTFWANDSETPTTCLASQSTCYETATGVPFDNANLEWSSYPYCLTGEERWPLSAMRYFWDVFDNHNDDHSDGYSAAVNHLWQHFFNLGWYPEGTGTNQIDETWNSTRTALDASDGRGSSSYMANYSANVTQTLALHTNNCSPP